MQDGTMLTNLVKGESWWPMIFKYCRERSRILKFLLSLKLFVEVALIPKIKSGPRYPGAFWLAQQNLKISEAVQIMCRGRKGVVSGQPHIVGPD